MNDFGVLMYRRLFQYSLRTFLIAVFLIGSVFGWIANYSIGFRGEQKSLEAMMGDGKFRVETYDASLVVLNGGVGIFG